LELALAESEAKLKQEAEARWLADTVLARTRDEARAAANSAALAAEEAEKRIVELEGELEARDHDIEEKTGALKSATLAWKEAEKRIAELEDTLAASARDSAQKAVAAEIATREVTPLIHEAEARARAAENKYEVIEARLRFELELRAAAEQKIQSLENEFKSDLEMDWARFEADIEKAEAAVRAREEAIAKTSAEHARREVQDLLQRLSAQLEAEQRARSEIERRLAESEAAAEMGKGKFNPGIERRLSEMEAALKAANSARVEAERKLAEVERARVSSFAPVGALAGAGAGPRPAGPEPKTIEAEVKLRAPEAPPRKPPRGIKVEPTKPAAKSARKGGSSSSLLTLGLSTESPPPAPTPDTSRKEEIKLVGYVAAISLLLLILIVLGLTAYRLL
jgi:chromosome segregation ATPase